MCTYTCKVYTLFDTNFIIIITTDIEGAVEIYTPQRPYTIYVRTNSEKKLWLPKLQETIYHYLLANDKCYRNEKLDCSKFNVQ